MASASGLLVSAGTANAATGGSLSLEVCAEGNYTAYAKFVEHGLQGDKGTATPKATAGSCKTTTVYLYDRTDPGTIWLFGIYNTSYQVFVVPSLFFGESRNISQGTSGVTIHKILTRAAGKTTSPISSGDAWYTDGFHVQL
jgi:hypothetical protein